MNTPITYEDWEKLITYRKNVRAMRKENDELMDKHYPGYRTVWYDAIPMTDEAEAFHKRVGNDRIQYI